MRLRFEPDLPHQRDAIDAVCDLFAGAEVGASTFSVPAPRVGVEAAQGRLYGATPEAGYANRLALPPDVLLANLRAVQLRNGLRQDAELGALDFAVEMETGTGKTYVYLRMALELHRRFGWTKFVVVVPSVAIKQGVLKGFDITREHLRGLYDGVGYERVEYDGADLSRVRDFATSRGVRVMVATVQALYPDAGRVAYQAHERTGGDRPIDLIRGTNPVVIIDEPQSVEGGEGGVGAKAIEGLKPLAVLRYSATHLRTVHEVYRLDAVEAFGRRLVKRIEVAAAAEVAAHNKPYVRLVGVRAKKGGGPRATVELDVASANGGVLRKEVVLTGDEDLQQTTRRAVYENVRLGEVRAGKGEEQMVELRLPGDTVWLHKGQTHGGIDAGQFERMLIERAVAAHLDKELVRRGLGIKVLTLFFVDAVADYREYDAAGNAVPGRLARMFEEVYEGKKNDPKYHLLFTSVEKDLPASAVHDGYFAKDAKGRLKDTRDTAASVNGRDAKEAFDLIMKDKEKLLSLSEPLKFIFSHSALREGWDNPNVFQVCSLRAMGSERQRRQTLGRGLRLCVGADGARVRDEDLNVLTVVAGESYADYAAKLQREYEEEGVVFGRIEPHEFSRLRGADGQPVGQEASEWLHAALRERGYLEANGSVGDALRRALKENRVEVPAGFEGEAADVVSLLRGRAGRRLAVADAANKVRVGPQRSVIDSAGFQALWERVRDRTTYRVDFDTGKLIAACVKSLNGQPMVERARVQWVIGGVALARGGVETSDEVVTETRYVEDVGVPLPDAVGLLQERTGLTRSTVAAVLTESGRAGELPRNPQGVIKMVGDAIEEQKHAAMVDGIRYQRTGAVWAQELFDRTFERDLAGLVEGGDRSAHERVPVDSDVERLFLRELKADSRVKFFAKLPRAFKVPTPLGNYEPDWAVLVERGGEERLYLVVETKGGLFESARRSGENQKIECGRAHFAAVGAGRENPARYAVARTLEGALATR